jgi:hypothetical protein
LPRQAGRRSQQQFEPEHASHADSAFDADHAFHLFDHPLAHHEADAGAFLGAASLSETVERLKELRHFFRRQSRAGIFDADANAFRLVTAHVTSTVPRSRLYLIALDSRLMRTCFTRVRSAVDMEWDRHTGETVMPMPRCCACGSIMAWHSDMTSAKRRRVRRNRQRSRIRRPRDRGLR